jgi:hypothetical protein
MPWKFAANKPARPVLNRALHLAKRRKSDKELPTVIFAT